MLRPVLIEPVPCGGAACVPAWGVVPGDHARETPHHAICTAGGGYASSIAR
jgi:hypothetical protein